MRWIIEWFSTKEFLPRECCSPAGVFPYDIKIQFMVADSITAVVYFLLSYFIIEFIYRINLSKSQKLIFVCFGMFIFFCGMTHIIDVFIFKFAIYKFSLFIKIITAIVSFITLIVVFYYRSLVTIKLNKYLNRKHK